MEDYALSAARWAAALGALLVIGSMLLAWGVAYAFNKWAFSGHSKIVSGVIAFIFALAGAFLQAYLLINSFDLDAMALFRGAFLTFIILIFGIFKSIYSPDAIAHNVNSLKGIETKYQDMLERFRGGPYNIYTLLVGFLAGCIVTYMLYQGQSPKTYDDCILDSLQGAQSQAAAVLIQRSCASKYPNRFGDHLAIPL